MLRVVSDGLWGEIKKAARSNPPAFAAIAYVTTDAYLKFERGDVLVCDASDQAIAAAQTSVKVLRNAVRRGAKVFSSPGLHAKAIVLGRRAIVGSANMSESSATVLDEAAIITDDARAVAGVRVLVEQLARSADPVDAAFLARAAKIKVNAPRRGIRRLRGGVTLRAPRAWLISLVPLDDEQHPEETKLVESEQKKAERSTEYSDSDAGYARFIGNSRFRREARDGDLVITVWKPHSKSKRAVVYAPEPLLHRKDARGASHFFIEEYADREETALPFSKFKALWQSAELPGRLTVNSMRELSAERAEVLRQLWPGR